MMDFDEVDRLLDQNLNNKVTDTDKQTSQETKKRSRSASPERVGDSKKRKTSEDDGKKNDRHKRSSSRDRPRRSGSRERRRSRSRDRDRHRRSKSRDRDRHRRSRSRDRQRRSKSRDRHRRSKSSEKRSKSQDRDLLLSEVTDRDYRTVFVYNLPLKATERDVAKFFDSVGKVRDVRLITDRNSRKSKGFGYVELDSVNQIAPAIELSGTYLMNKPVMVQSAQAERNKIVNLGSNTKVNANGPTRLYVGGLHFTVAEADLERVFTVFGELDTILLARESETGHSKGYAIVNYKTPEAAKRALVQVNGQELVGQPMKVHVITENSNIEGDLDEAGIDAGLALNPQSRNALMMKLNREVSLSGADVPSACIILKNMFDESDTREPNFEIELTEDVREECSKFGPILHIYVERMSQGFIYVRFSNSTAATRAYNELNGRWFGGKMIAVCYIQERDYNQLFPQSKN